MNDGTQGGGIWIAVGVISGYVFRWLGERDKYRYDAKIINLENENQAQAAHMASQDKKIVSLEHEGTEFKTKHGECEQNLRSVRSDIREIRRIMGAAGAKDTPVPEDTQSSGDPYVPPKQGV
jgi:hypothetical protein